MSEVTAAAEGDSQAPVASDVPGLTPEEIGSLYEFVAFGREGETTTVGDVIELWRRMGVACPKPVAERLIAEAKTSEDTPLDRDVFVETMTKGTFGKERVDEAMAMFGLFKKRHASAMQDKKYSIPKDVLASIFFEYAKLDPETARTYADLFQPDSEGEIDFRDFLGRVTDKDV